MTPESRIMREQLVALSAAPNTIVWRHNSGQAWQGQRLKLSPGQTIEVQPNMVILANARPVSFGLAGSADIIGCSSGLPLAVESKAKGGSQRELQRNFERVWKKAGGVYILSASVDDMLTQLRLASIGLD